jgi:cytochrome P450
VTRTVPGPTGRPPLEELKVLRDGPHEFLRELTDRYGPALRYPLGPFRFYLFAHPEAVQHVLVTNHGAYGKNTFQYRLLSEITGDGLLTMDGPAWLARRRLAQPSFHRARIAEFAPIFTRYADALVTRWAGFARSREPVDVAADMMHVALQAVAQTLFGAEVGDRASALWRATLDVLHHLMFRARTFGIVPPWLPVPRNRRFRRSIAVLDESIYATIRDRRRASATSPTPQDLLQRLMDAGAGDPASALSDRQLRDEMITLLIAGHETVASALTWTWYLLAADPDADAALEAELRGVLGERLPTAEDLPRLVYTRAVFEEAMRLYPPAWVITRRVLAEDEVQGVPLPRGALVILSPYVTQRHSDYWDEPDAFRPERFIGAAGEGRHRYAYFPFGGGPHLCIGNHFALVEATLMIATIAQRYRVEAMPGRRVEVDPGVTLQPRGGLPMLVVRRETYTDPG